MENKKVKIDENNMGAEIIGNIFIGHPKNVPEQEVDVIRKIVRDVQGRELTEMDPRTEKEKAEDLKLIKLPVKKIPDNGGRPEFGFLLAIEKPIVYLKNMCDLQELGVGFPSGDASGNFAKLMGAKPIRREGGYRGSYEELFENILISEQKIIYASRFIEKDEDDDGW